MNKYQEAKDFIKSIANNEYLTDIFDTSLDTLQELIDKYSKLEKALDKACKELDDKYFCHRGIRISCDDENCICCIKEYLLQESEKQ